MERTTRSSVLHHSFSEPDRQGLSYEQVWREHDQGLIKCWENGRSLARKDPDLAERCKAGALPILNWKGGVSRALKNMEKFGSLKYLVQWQGLRGDDLHIDLNAELSLTCSVTGMIVTFTPDLTKLANQKSSDDGESAEILVDLLKR
ncbi:hypothetical protein ACEN2T_20225 [Pseudomonas sp. W22_MBD1_FP4]|uniref:hypothetical protein n=1 Tax=Pseudomonas sp. W22_MBD1_FP4 TaxID=3240272 RepID=UPI003F986BD8